tara:strand:+ start:944 stop:1387 length:444 start_codon:yes stop_codon:yes gene_type:complete
MATIQGDVIILSVYDVTGTAYKPVACLTSNSLNQTATINESQTKCTPGVVTKTKGATAYNISAEGEYIDTTSVGGSTTLASHDFLKALFEGSANVFWRMSTGLADTTFYYGESIISDLSLSAPTAENSTFSSTLEGTGAIVTVDPKA